MLLYICFFISLLTWVKADIGQPNIVFICADDLGWGDVSYLGSDQILTPNIDVLAYHGVVLKKYYTDTQGTPSRSALLTGKYPMRLGTQGPSIKVAEDHGIPEYERLLPSYLRELGYATYLVGKWNVGKSRDHYLPTNRGFQSFYGFLDDSVDYFTYNTIATVNGTEFFGLNLYNDLEPAEQQFGHLTYLLTDKAVSIIRKHNTSQPLYLHLAHAAPHAGGGLVNLQPPGDSITANDHIAHSARRLYAGLVTSLDKSIGHIIAALAERDILQNTIIVFVSDNGAPTVGPSQNFGSNLPLRGVKSTPWEGAVRVPAFIWHHSLKSAVRNDLFHVTDWLPTLIDAAGGNISEGIDGISQWDAIKYNKKSERDDIVITTDDLNQWAALRSGDFKLIVGEINHDVSGHHGKDYKHLRRAAPAYEETLLESETYRVFKETLELPLDIFTAYRKRNNSLLTSETNEMNSNNQHCIPTKVKGCLFNITADPLELNDLWHTSPQVVRQLALRLRTIWSELKPRGVPQGDLRANPSLRNFVWVPWVENDEKLPPAPKMPPVFPLQVSLGELQYLVDLNFNMFRNKLNDYINNMGNSFVKSVGGLFSF